MPGDRHGGFGERPGETDREQSRHRAPGRLNQGILTLMRPNGWSRRQPRLSTDGSMRITLGHVEPERMSLEWSPGERLTPWLVLDLPRAAWIVERRAAELTAEERQIVRDAADRMLRAVGGIG